MQNLIIHCFCCCCRRGVYQCRVFLNFNHLILNFLSLCYLFFYFLKLQIFVAIIVILDLTAADCNLRMYKLSATLEIGSLLKQKDVSSMRSESQPKIFHNIVIHLFSKETGKKHNNFILFLITQRLEIRNKVCTMMTEN